MTVRRSLCTVFTVLALAWGLCLMPLMNAEAQAPVQVNVRAGAHATFTRVVFDWPVKVPYKITKDGGLVTVIFEAAARIDDADLNRNPPLFVGGIRSATEGGRTVSVIAVPPRSTVRDFYAGNKIALDVREPAPWQDPAALPAQVSVPGGGKTPAAAQAAEAKPAAPATETVPPVAAAPAKPAVAAQALPQPPIQKPPASTAATKTAPAAAGTATRTAQQLPQRSAQKAAPAGQPLLLTPPAQATATAAAAPAQPPRTATAQASGQAAGGAAAQAPAPGPAPSAQLSVAKGDEGTVTLRFDWAEPVAAAAFRRNGFLWLVFDKRTNVNVPALQEAGGAVISTLQQVYIPQATVLRMTTPKDINPSMRRAGLAWLIDFRAQEATPKIPLEVQAQPDSPIGARIFMPLPEPGKVIPLTDPIVADNMLVVPGIPLGHGVAGTYAYPQFEILPSIQGVVVTPRIDDVRVRSLRQGVEIASAAPTFPLKFSPVSQEMAASARMSAMRPLVRILDLEKWDTPNDAAILQTRAILEQALAVAPKAGQREARMNLARFYFANAYGAEALGVLAHALEVQPSLAQDREWLLLHGGAQFLLGRLPEAEKDLYNAALNGSDEGEFWRAIIQAARGDLNGASIELRRSGSIARPYPRALRFRLSTIVAEAVVEIGDVRTAETLISTLLADSPSPSQEAQIKFVQGRLAELEGDFDGAVSLWEDVMDSPDRLARFRAARSRVELLLRLDRMTKREATEELEKQRFAWRGDNREFDLLRRLGALYLEQDKYREALQTLRQAATHFRDHPDAKAVTKEMSDTFNALYLEDKADTLKPVTAIAIYEEFKELTPAGSRGDTMIQKLADRLVGVDLLDQAAALLEGQIKFRLQGADRARVGARLGLIHLLARKYVDAERVIRATTADGLNADLAQQRNHLLVQALMGQKRYADGLALLEPDESMDGNLLRSEIYWTMGNWNDAAQVLQRVVTASGARRGEKLNRKQARYMLNLATAMTLSGNERGLARIRDSFGAAMAKTEMAKAFDLIAARPALGLIAPESVKERVAVAQNFKSFLTAYRERLEKDPLSAIN
ncbi:tetratricopeptide repeat protein [Thalassospiraceae bacterium LMO-SO8]|nr:tetratricopeptide repeat protein [Alphaproteobacteria bacterium LMO-S08]WND75013.1 tetratricopeptide repeat protein [Thalassospiraceae bacterium LMO-SO8]